MSELDIENFCDITNASAEEARNFLQVKTYEKKRRVSISITKISYTLIDSR
jgi:hypothetical protein